MSHTHMKAPKTPFWRMLSRAPYARSLPLGILAAAMLSQAQAVNVDSELVLLVDTTNSALNNTQFSTLMNAYATTFSSSQIMDSIQSGAYKKIAVSMMFFGTSNSLQVGIPWMEIGNSTQALQFATLLQNVNRPAFSGTSELASALTGATAYFGTETGFAANGFESEVQLVEVAASRRPNNNTAAAATVSSGSSLAAGVDMINSVALGNQANAIDAFYTANVVGSTIPGAPATSDTSALNGTLAANLNSILTSTVQTGANTSIVTAVPEPDTSLALAAGILLLIRRRRR